MLFFILKPTFPKCKKIIYYYKEERGTLPLSRQTRLSLPSSLHRVGSPKFLTSWLPKWHSDAGSFLNRRKPLRRSWLMGLGQEGGGTMLCHGLASNSSQFHRQCHPTRLMHRNYLLNCYLYQLWHSNIVKQPLSDRDISLMCNIDEVYLVRVSQKRVSRVWPSEISIPN